MLNKYNRIWVLLGLACGLGTASAQSKFVPDNADQKVGELIFQSPKTITFTFENKGNRPLVIKEVHPSCGCTEASWPKIPIPVGGKGSITAIYDAKMMGTFYKELAVYTNASEEPSYLSFQGRVVETPLDYSGNFPIDLGSLRLSTNTLEFDDVNKGDKAQVEFEVANLERGAYRPELMHLPHYLSAEYIPEVIQGGRVGKIRVTLDSEKLYMDGLNQSEIYLARYQGDKVSDENSILVSAILLPTFSELTASQMAKAPQLVFSEDVMNLDFAGRKKASKVIEVTNDGEEILTIRKVQVFNSALEVSLGDRNLAPHKTTKLKVTVNEKELKKTKGSFRVLIISNDPRHAKSIIPVNVTNSK